MLGPPSKTFPAESIQPLCTQKSIHRNLTLLKSRAHKRPTSDPMAHRRSLMSGFSPPHPCALLFFFSRARQKGIEPRSKPDLAEKQKRKNTDAAADKKKESPAKVSPGSPRLAHRPRSLRPGFLRTTHSPAAQLARPPLRHHRTASASSLRRPS
jgi:hypothetical protein